MVFVNCIQIKLRDIMNQCIVCFALSEALQCRVDMVEARADAEHQ